MLKKILAFTAVLLVLVAAAAPANAGEKDVARLIYFYSPSCEHCARVRANVIPLIEKYYSDSLEVAYSDISEPESYKELFDLKHKYSDDEKTVFPVLFMNGRFIDQRDIESGGDKAIFSFIKDSINSRAAEKKGFVKADIIEYFKKIKPLAILGAGLVDGVNPCSFTVIVFFLSFLALQRYDHKTITWAGSAFILACFITYVAIGLGVLAPLYAFKGFRTVTQAINSTIGVLSIALGALSLYDALKFMKTKNPEDSILQLPKRVKNSIHSIIGSEYRVTKEGGEQKIARSSSKIFFGALAIGFSVSILESICTGQLYLPTIIFVLKTSPYKLQALGYLFAYNLMFILPICVIFLFALAGMTSHGFASIMKKYFIVIKLAMAALFIVLGASLVWAEEADAPAVNAPARQKTHSNVVIDPNSYDFGKVKQGEVLKHDFMLKNNESETITIKEVNTSCACASPKVDKKTIAPGESVPVGIVFDTRGYSGIKKRQLFVHTDSKKNPLVIFEVEADIQW
ncbi:MAG: DUF1573 domain-containing protein [Candidatus Omnitrophica bacterium]|nr:DUF1573 domain-containing protein [Candidatus Omnitrophota bacterium]